MLIRRDQGHRHRARPAHQPIINQDDEAAPEGFGPALRPRKDNMPRTAITVARTHEGKWTLLGHPGIPLVAQLKTYRGFLGEKVHEKFAYVQLQESDGVERHVHLRTPDDHEAHQERRAAEQKSADEAGVAEVAKAKEGRDEADQARQDRHEAELRSLEAPAAGKKKGPPAKPQAPAPEANQAPPVNESGLRLDGPTIEDWQVAGMNPVAYPPAGYAERPSDGLEKFKADQLAATK